MYDDCNPVVTIRQIRADFRADPGGDKIVG
jgi:hypothetical protein